MIPVAIDHLHLRSLDPDAAARFYVESFGGAVADRIEAPDSLRVIVALAGLRIFIERAGEETAPAATPPHRGLEHIGLTVRDLDAAVSQLKAAGTVFTMEPKALRPGLRIAFLLGPDGVLIELLEREAAL